MARSAIFLFFVALFAPFGATAQSPLEQAVTLARQSRYAEAKELLQAVPEPGPAAQRIAFHRLKAAVAAGLHDPATAVTEMQHALAVAPTDPALLLATAVAELNAGQLDAALRHAESSGGSDPRTLAVVGDIQEKRGDFPRAIAAWRDAVRLDPSREEYRTTLVFALILHQDFAAAIEVVKPAIAAFPKSSRLRTLLGIAQFALGDSEDAAATLSAAIAIDSRAEPAYRSLAQIVLQSSAAPEAAIMTQLCAWNATVCSALKLRAARESGDLALQTEATAGLERAPQADVIARCELARAREWANRLSEARTEMEKCLAADPSPQNHYRLGLIYQRLGLADLAKKEIELRRQLLAHMSEQTANGLSALQTLR